MKSDLRISSRIITETNYSLPSLPHFLPQRSGLKARDSYANSPSPCKGETGFAHSSQINSPPSKRPSREPPSTKTQTATAHISLLDLGPWSFSGAWMLVLGAFASAHLRLKHRLHHPFHRDAIEAPEINRAFANAELEASVRAACSELGHLVIFKKKTLPLGHL
jgi:hypothetical protein